MLNKQAKILSDGQIEKVLTYLSSGRNCTRNRVMFLLSMHGLRSVEIASLELSMLTDAEGNLTEQIALEDKASKGKSGRIIFINADLKKALALYLEERTDHDSEYLIVTERSKRFSANAVSVFFKRLYSKVGLEGVSSHSGRRTFITRAARKISQAGGSLKDVQALVGHRHLTTTQAYVIQDVDAQRNVVSLLY